MMSFAVHHAGRRWTSETDLIDALHQFIDIGTQRHNIDKSRLIDASRQWCHSVEITDEWQILSHASSAIHTIAKRDTGAITDIYYGITSQSSVHGTCSRCGGTGDYRYSNGAIGVCYGCNGQPL